MKSRRVTIRTGIVAKDYISNYGLREIIEGIGNKMRKGKYYSALIQILKEIESYYKYKYKYSTMTIIFFIIIYCIIYVILFFICYWVFYFIAIFIIIIIITLVSYIIDLYKKFSEKSLPNDDKLKKIVIFLKNQKSNKKILTDNCAICLEKINKEEEKEIENNNEINNIKILLKHY